MQTLRLVPTPVFILMNLQPDDLATLLEALAAVLEVDPDLWLDESLRYPILGQARILYLQQCSAIL